jgi:ribosomal protein L29
VASEEQWQLKLIRDTVRKNVLPFYLSLTEDGDALKDIINAAIKYLDEPSNVVNFTITLIDYTNWNEDVKEELKDLARNIFQYRKQESVENKRNLLNNIITLIYVVNKKDGNLPLDQFIFRGQTKEEIDNELNHLLGRIFRTIANNLNTIPSDSLGIPGCLEPFKESFTLLSDLLNNSEHSGVKATPSFVIQEENANKYKENANKYRSRPVTHWK